MQSVNQRVKKWLNYPENHKLFLLQVNKIWFPVSINTQKNQLYFPTRTPVWDFFFYERQAGIKGSVYDTTTRISSVNQNIDNGTCVGLSFLSKRILHIIDFWDP